MEGVARGLLLSEAGSKRKVLRRVVRRVEESCLRPLKECSGLDGSEPPYRDAVVEGMEGMVDAVLSVSWLGRKRLPGCDACRLILKTTEEAWLVLI